MTRESVNRLISQLSQEPERDIVLYLSSIGGEVSAAEMLRHYLDNSDTNFILVAAGDVSSSMFHLYYNSTCYKTMLQYTSAVLHQPTMDIQTRDFLKKDKLTRKSLAILEDMKTSYSNIARSILTSEDYARFLEGEDILLITDELLEIMKKCPYGEFREKISDFFDQE